MIRQCAVHSTYNKGVEHSLFFGGEHTTNLIIADAKTPYHDHSDDFLTVWLIGAVVCLLAANIWSADAGNGWPHSAPR